MKSVAEDITKDVFTTFYTQTAYKSDSNLEDRKIKEKKTSFNFKIKIYNILQDVSGKVLVSVKNSAIISRLKLSSKKEHSWAFEVYFVKGSFFRGISGPLSPFYIDY